MGLCREEAIPTDPRRRHMESRNYTNKIIPRLTCHPLRGCNPCLWLYLSLSLRLFFSSWHVKTSAFYTDITAQETTQFSELEQMVELVWTLQGNHLLIPSPVASWFQNGRGDDVVRSVGIVSWVRIQLWGETYFYLYVKRMERKKNRAKKARWEEMEKTPGNRRRSISTGWAINYTFQSWKGNIVSFSSSGIWRRDRG